MASHASDDVFANVTARHLVTDFALLRDLTTKQHLGLQVTIDLNLARQRAVRLLHPVPYQPPPAALTPEERHPLGDQVEAALLARITAAVGQNFEGGPAVASRSLPEAQKGQ